MKKKLLLFLTVLLSMNFIFALDIGQKIYPLDSDIYSNIEMLYLLEGHSLPSTAKP